MPTNKLHLTIHQTFDLNTAVDRITVLGVRTPSPAVVNRYVNMQNWRKIKFNYCNFKLACVSQLPVDPLGVGFEAGQIAPQELVNPMLFKTVTGDSISSILDIIYSDPDNFNQKNTLTETKISDIEDGDATVASPMDAYYTLLGDDSFRQAHPQVGLEARGLVPLVREVLSVKSMMSKGTSSDDGIISPMGQTGGINANLIEGPGFAPKYSRTGQRITVDDVYDDVPNFFVSGNVREMPSFDVLGTAHNHSTTDVQVVPWPVQHVAVCVMPPAIQKSLYYRCIVSWNITLSGFFPTYLGSNALGTASTQIYNNWMEVPVSQGTASAMENMEDNTGVISTTGVDNIRKVAENVS